MSDDNISRLIQASEAKVEAYNSVLIALKDLEATLTGMQATLSSLANVAITNARTLVIVQTRLDTLADFLRSQRERTEKSLEEERRQAFEISKLQANNSGAKVSVEGSTIAVGDGTNAVGSRGVKVGGDVGGSATSGDGNQI